MVSGSSHEDMKFEVHEAERAFDFVNVTFGAFLGAFLGYEFAQAEPTSWLAIRIAALLVTISFTALALRGFGLPLILGTATFKHSVSSIVTLAFGVIAFVAVCSELDYSVEFMGVIGLSWLVAPLLVMLPLAARRWIKIYE